MSHCRDHIFTGRGSPRVHHPTSDYLVRIRDDGRRHLRQSRCHEQIKRRLFPIGGTPPCLGLEPLVHGKLYAHVTQAKEARRQAPPEYRDSPLLVQPHHGPHHAVGLSFRRGHLKIVEGFSLHPRPDDEHGIADDVRDAPRRDGRAQVHQRVVVVAPVPVLGRPVMNSALEILVQGKINAPERRNGCEGGPQSAEAAAHAVREVYFMDGFDHPDLVGRRALEPSRHLHARPHQVERSTHDRC
mmetsp:Transcript_50491/g.107547  ORF Transcript_50491/g.107547 Transcript_50491/m.107547 type:complete len:242 (+) Transcript_50491:393-1118(+)